MTPLSSMKNQLTRTRRHIFTYGPISQAPGPGEYQFAEGQANNHVYLDDVTSWSYGSRVSDSDFGDVPLPNGLPTPHEEECWYPGMDPQLEDPARLGFPRWNTSSSIGSESIEQPSQGYPIPYGHTEYLNPSNEQHFETNGAAVETSEQRLCFGMVRIKR